MFTNDIKAEFAAVPEINNILGGRVFNLRPIKEPDEDYAVCNPTKEFRADMVSNFFRLEITIFCQNTANREVLREEIYNLFAGKLDLNGRPFYSFSLINFEAPDFFLDSGKCYAVFNYDVRSAN